MSVIYDKRYHNAREWLGTSWNKAPLEANLIIAEASHLIESLYLQIQDLERQLRDSRCYHLHTNVVTTPSWVTVYCTDCGRFLAELDRTDLIDMP